MLARWRWMTRHLARRLRQTLVSLIREPLRWRSFWNDYREYTRQAAAAPEIRHLYPCLWDATSHTPVSAMYFYQDTWAFERLIAMKPSWHLDVGSHHLFVAFLSRLLPVTMVDVRPIDLPLPGLQLVRGSILDLPYPSDSVPSVSSLCVVEHIGLGRYGDPIDPEGTFKAIAELKRVTARGGSLYLSLPVGDGSRVHFNAHRVLDEAEVLEALAPFILLDRGYIFRRQWSRTRELQQQGLTVGCYHLEAP